VEEEHLRLDLPLFVLENNWLREQVGSNEATVSDRSGDYLPEPELTDTEGIILEALGTCVLKGAELLKLGGYDYSSHYRQILSNLTKRQILGRSIRGYYNPREVQEDPTRQKDGGQVKVV
jgi:hypothetical protein